MYELHFLIAHGLPPFSGTPIDSRDHEEIFQDLIEQLAKEDKIDFMFRTTINRDTKMVYIYGGSEGEHFIQISLKSIETNSDNRCIDGDEKDIVFEQWVPDLTMWFAYLERDEIL